MSTSLNVHIAVIGVGGVGEQFLSQLEALAHRYLSHPTPPLHISLVYISRSTKALHGSADSPISFSNWRSTLDASSTPPLSLPDLASTLATSASAPRTAAILVDNTSSQALAESYPLFLSSGVSVVTPNKKAFSGDLGIWDAIFAAAAHPGTGSGGYVFHESTVGAGLPVISTLRELLETGDVVTRIEGVFSGTMSYLFNNFMPASGGGSGKKFSEEVKTAAELGFTEPDARDDLNGLDVARKLTILARIAGLRVKGPTEFPVQSLIPKELESVGSGEEFLERLPEFDGQIEEVKKEAEGEGKVLRYVGSIDVQKGDVEVGLQKFDKSHPIAALKGSANIISFYSKRYGDSALIVQGSGAGGEVTAMGVIGDLIKVFNLLK